MVWRLPPVRPEPYAHRSALMHSVVILLVLSESAHSHALDLF